MGEGGSMSYSGNLNESDGVVSGGQEDGGAMHRDEAGRVISPTTAQNKLHGGGAVGGDRHRFYADEVRHM